MAQRRKKYNNRIRVKVDGVFYWVPQCVMNNVNRIKRLREKYNLLPAELKLKRKLLRGMTNWQLTQWNRAKSPDDLVAITNFAHMKKAASHV